MIQDIPQAQEQNLESVFISGMDPSISEKELQELIRFTVGGSAQLTMTIIKACGQEKTLAEVKCKLEEANIIHHKLNNTHLKTCFLKLIPQACMKSLIIQNLPRVFNEKDLFIILNQITPNAIKRIIIADNPEVIGETLGVAVAIYQSNEQALKAMKLLKQQGEIMKCKIDVNWKEPDFDIIKELSMQTRVLCVKNFSQNTDTSKIRDAFQIYGTVLRIQRYSTHGFIEFLTIESAQNALAALNDKRFEGGLVWHIYPAKKLDIERVHDDADRNRIFSKNFLEEQDQQSLRKFLFDGQLPILDTKVIQTTANIIQQIKKGQNDKIQLLSMQIENLRILQGTQNNNENNNSNNNKKQNQNQNANFAANNMNMFNSLNVNNSIGGGVGEIQNNMNTQNFNQNLNSQMNTNINTNNQLGMPNANSNLMNQNSVNMMNMNSANMMNMNAANMMNINTNTPNVMGVNNNNNLTTLMNTNSNNMNLNNTNMNIPFNIPNSNTWAMS